MDVRRRRAARAGRRSRVDTNGSTVASRASRRHVDTSTTGTRQPPHVGLGAQDVTRGVSIGGPSGPTVRGSRSARGRTRDASAGPRGRRSEHPAGEQGARGAGPPASERELGATSTPASRDRCGRAWRRSRIRVDEGRRSAVPRRRAAPSRRLGSPPGAPRTGGLRPLALPPPRPPSAATGPSAPTPPPNGSRNRANAVRLLFWFHTPNRIRLPFASAAVESIRTPPRRAERTVRPTTSRRPAP
jgi:hypothetical protein